ncbi:MAG: hypothetical protein M3256_26995 [Actinomycetota bacterium]|nr:hypothetical protein [Actinomycetota bacterium]
MAASLAVILVTAFLLPSSLALWFGSLIGILTVSSRRLWFPRVGSFMRGKWRPLVGVLILVSVLILVALLLFAVLLYLLLGHGRVGGAPRPPPTHSPFKNYFVRVTATDPGMQVFNVDVRMDFDPALYGRAPERLNNEDGQLASFPAQPVRIATYTVRSHAEDRLLLRAFEIPGPRGQVVSLQSATEATPRRTDVCRDDCPEVQGELYNLRSKAFVSAYPGHYDLQPAESQHETVRISVTSRDAEQPIVVEHVSPTVAAFRPFADWFIGIGKPGDVLGLLLGLLVGTGAMFGSTLVTLAATTYAKRLLARVHVKESGIGAEAAQPGPGRPRGGETDRSEPDVRRKPVPRGGRRPRGRP